MKRILLMAMAIFLSYVAVAQSDPIGDSVLRSIQAGDLAARRAFEGLKSRPSFVSEETARDMIIHPGRIDSVQTDLEYSLDYFYPLPYVGTCRDRVKYTHLLYIDGKWIVTKRSEVLRPSSVQVHLDLIFVFILPFMLALFTLHYGLIALDMRKWSREGDPDRIMSSAMSLIGQRKKFLLSRIEVVLIVGIYAVLLFGIDANANAWISMVWWLVLLIVLSYFARNFFLTMVLNYSVALHQRAETPKDNPLE